MGYGMVGFSMPWAIYTPWHTPSKFMAHAMMSCHDVVVAFDMTCRVLVTDGVSHGLSHWVSYQ